MDSESSKRVNDRDTMASGVRPGFLGGTGGGERPAGLSKEEKRRSATDELKNAEQAAEGARDSAGVDETGLVNARQNEERAGGYYSGSGIAPKAKNSGFKGKFKKRGPIFGIIFAIFGVGGIMAGTQFFQPFSLIAQFQETFNSMHVSANLRSERFFRAQMDSGRTKNPIKGNAIFGKTFKISENQNAELKKQGIEFDDNFQGSNLKVLKYKDESGEIKIIAADEATAKKLTEMDLSKFDTDGIKYNTEAVEFKRFYMDSPGFFTKYNAGSMTWRGQIANWFKSGTDNFLKNNKLTRNMFADYKEKKSQAGGDGLAAVKSTLEARTDEIKDGGINSRQASDDVDDDGNPIYVEEDGKTKKKLKKTDTSGAQSDSISRKNINVKEKLDRIGGKYTSAANVGCAAVGVIGAVSLLVSASEALQIINLTTGYFETVDKTKAGYGDDAPINELMNTLNERKENKNVVLETTGKSYSGESSFIGMNGDGGIDTLTSREVITDKTAMQSAGVAALYSGGIVDPNDASVQSFNFTNSSKRILGGLGTSMAAFETCTIAKIAGAVGSAALDGATIASCIAGLFGMPFTFGISAGACSGLVLKTAVSVAAGVAMGVVIGGIIAAITPSVSSMLTRDLVSELGGEDLGNALTSGANMYQGGAHRANGGSLMSREKYEQYAVQRQQVIADNARYEREWLSPFDLTSKNTFMGKIMTNLMSFTASNSLMSVVASGSAVISSSLVAMGPTASAYDIASSLPTLEEYSETCPYLASIGAIGDSYCNPYAATDTSTMDVDPADVIDKVNDLGGLADGENGGNVVIDEGSNLAKYIRYCDNRSSAFGIADQNIANELNEKTTFDTGSAVVDNAGNGLIGSVPVIGDVIDIIENENMKKNIGYISGESCVAGNTVNASESPNWDEAKYYQRFIEDQALAESMGLVDKSAVTAYLEKYYEENPIDDSYEGMLARYSGMDKETVTDLLDVIAYYNYVAEYNPAERYAFAEEDLDLGDRVIDYGDEDVLGGEGVLLGGIVYADVRNRSFAV